MSPIERGIDRGASRALVTTYAGAGKAIRAQIKTLEALDAYWVTGAALFTRNHVNTSAAIAARGTETGTVAAGNGIRNAAARKTAGASAKGKVKSRGAGA